MGTGFARGIRARTAQCGGTEMPSAGGGTPRQFGSGPVDYHEPGVPIAGSARIVSGPKGSFDCYFAVGFERDKRGAEPGAEPPTDADRGGGVQRRDSRPGHTNG